MKNRVLSSSTTDRGELSFTLACALLAAAACSFALAAGPISPAGSTATMAQAA
jgi:hypothetical protein